MFYEEKLTKLTKLGVFKGKMRISKKKFKEACKGSGGVQAVVARAIGVTRQSLFTYLKKHPEMKKFLDEEGEQILDVAEHTIDKFIIEGDGEYCKWALINRKRGKARGYGPKQEMEHTGASPVTFIEVTKTKEQIKDERNRNRSKSETKTNP